MKSLTDTIGSNSRALVLDRAAKLFRERGYASVSMRDIAATSGMKAASLYHHFRSKDEIVIEVLNIGVSIVCDEVRRCVEALPAGAPFGRKLHSAVEAHLRSLLEVADYTGATIRIFAQLPEGVRRATMAKRREYEQWWIEFLQGGVDAGDLDRGTDVALMEMLLLGTMNSSIEWFRPRQHDVRDIARRLTLMALYGQSAGQPQRIASAAASH